MHGLTVAKRTVGYKTDVRLVVLSAGVKVGYQFGEDKPLLSVATIVLLQVDQKAPLART